MLTDLFVQIIRVKDERSVRLHTIDRFKLDRQDIKGLYHTTHRICASIEHGNYINVYAGSRLLSPHGNFGYVLCSYMHMHSGCIDLKLRDG